MRKPPITETEEIFDIELEEDLLNRNRELAEANRRTLDEHGVRGLDVLGSIGSGKTTLVTEMIKRLKGRMEVAVLAGDLTTMIDAERIEEQGVPVLQIHTGKECHLDANLVRKALAELDLDGVDLLMIENVGNLICPGEFPLGAHQRLVVVSVTEGPYTAVKHPFIFEDAQVAVMNKMDLAEAMAVSLDELAADLQRVKPGIKVVATNARAGEGVDEVLRALDL
jgi:hydrogenase nickel incorporation protein HypB